MTSRLADLLEIAEAIEQFGPITGEPYSGPNRAIQLLREAVREQSARRSKAATGARSSKGRPPVTREQLEAFRDDWLARNGSLRGWLDAAIGYFGIDRRTILSRLK